MCVKPRAGEATPAEVLHSVQGLWCTSCALAVEAQLVRLPGVHSASLHYPSATLLVSGEPKALEEGRLAAAVARLGYRLAPPEAARDAAVRLEAESRYLSLRLLVAAVFGMWTMLASLLIYAGALPDAGLEGVMAWASGAFAVPVVTYAGWPFYRAAWRTLRARRPGMDALVSLGALGAVGVSLWLLGRGSSEVYFDTAVMLIGLLLVGRLVETLCRHRGLRALQALHMPPDEVSRWSQGRWQSCALEEVHRGDRLRVATGESIPLDGTLETAEARLDTAPLTGESAPRRCLSGEGLAAGCRNLGPALEMSVTAVAGECRLDRLREQMWWQQARKGELARLADRFAAWLSPLAVVLAVLTLAATWLAGVPAEEAMVRALSVLVVACPCAVGLAIPLAGLAGSGRALGRGVVFRDPAAFETLARVRSAAFDKTGTLTAGEPVVTQLRPAPGVEGQRLLALAALAARGSDHPLGRALRREAHDRGVSESGEVDQRQEIAGRGRRVRLADGRELCLGSRAWLAQRGIAVPEGDAGVDSEVALACDGRWLGSVLLGEAALPGTAETLARLRQGGLTLALISGDRPPAVRRLGRAVGLREAECFPGRSPEAKAALIAALPQPSLYVGDGLNDALGLATASVGVAPLGASSAAREGGAVVLLRPGIGGVEEAWDLARRTRRVMRQNLVLSALYNALALGLAVSMAIPPLVAVLAMVASSLSVMGNAARLAWSQPPVTGGGEVHGQQAHRWRLAGGAESRRPKSS
ncbi:cation-translocating P-type ATPase [Halomonas campisalis]|uniref:Cation-translocating P-type ATPase n=1 Tax=Billgrantia campisalis TaxID=74661 RepID=A0ABS9PDG0_9GAMM|nr:cation-translocating P-type ATPase [Halomonas campisalis]MCG6659287.1 cation-translocating P-type ATPase [Halomonas campisalis]MDR5864286.1 cation-translocating P-type ATPase [Halomonas campisalis]